MTGTDDGERAGASSDVVRGPRFAGTGADMATDDVPDWLEERRRAHRFRVRRIPFDQLDGWSFTADTGNLVHRTGRFFSVEGMHAVVGGHGGLEWRQPIIVQPEVGVLGLLRKRFDGVPHYLVQAKMEPGNVNTIQLSPTVQATHSNFTKAHGGSSVPYLDHFLGTTGARVLVDVLQSEQGSWFYRKSNRNMVVEVDGEVEPHEDFRWLTADQLGELLRRDDTVNMDTRTVLACAPGPDDGGSHTGMELLSWLTAERLRRDVRSRRIPLTEVEGWVRGDDTIDHASGRYFRVAAVRVEAGSREVGGWSQPLVEPVGLGVVAFLVQRFDGVPHVLAHARGEGGLATATELAPTVQYTPLNYEGHLVERPPFLDAVLSAAPEDVVYDTVHSEEGGRFLNARNRYLFVETEEHRCPPPGYRWCTPGQLRFLVGHSHQVNVQARTLLAVLGTGAVVL